MTMRVLIAVAALALLGSGTCEPPEHILDSRLVRDGLELHVDGPVGIIGPQSEDIARFWNDGCGQELFFTPTPTPDATVEFGYVPSDWEGWDDTVDETGIAYLTYSEFDGLIVACEIVISSDIAHDDHTVRQTGRHEAGHCLGMADSVHSLDYNSIMASPLVYDGEVTSEACELATEYFHE